MWDLGRFVLWSLKERDVGVVLLTAMVLRHFLRFRRKIWEMFGSVLHLNKLPGLQNGMEWAHAILASVALVMINHSSMEQEGPHFSDKLSLFPKYFSFHAFLFPQRLSLCKTPDGLGVLISLCCGSSFPSSDFSRKLVPPSVAWVYPPCLWRWQSSRTLMCSSCMIQ